jgi:hypothetical protein
MPRRNLIIGGLGLAALVAVLIVVVFARPQHTAEPVPTPTCTATVRVATPAPAPSSTAVPSRTVARATVPVPTATCTPKVSPTAGPSATRPRPTATLRPTATPHPAFVPGPLNGQVTAWAVAHRRPVAVMVENYNPDSRPQTGLSAASVVFETVAESGITRFMPVYLENLPPVVGPVRSARVYFDAWANGLHAVLVHAGGNDDALAQLFTLHNIADVNEVKWEDANYNPTVPFFARSPERVIPHNMYTYPAKVLAYERTQHIKLQGSFPDTLPHHVPDNPAHRPTGGVVDINFSSPDYAVEYRYDRASNRYFRFMGGVPHVEPTSNHQLAPSNVVVMLASIAPDPYGGVANPGAVYVQSTGKNVAYLFRDGKRTIGTWHKQHGGSPLVLLDSHQHPFSFNPGQTWFEVLPANGALSWTPGK